ncbi:hypothetical protein HMPREF0322_00531 [Desulfitobacterium hafniense DP7]|uniref:Uncharacterized protein n=2 Tax=Desulfitobacterium hafniense TaxID=49338 RepID=Q24P78_DESHY|nr:hypothetical protein HMPREF0322_00531 [Desulfitobacterium hafniense DP7]BAE86164.1 hypothetical protein DSY4375 [Desulfitobacterium hafniense Y51]
MTHAIYMIFRSWQYAVTRRTMPQAQRLSWMEVPKSISNLLCLSSRFRIYCFIILESSFIIIPVICNPFGIHPIIAIWIFPLFLPSPAIPIWFKLHRLCLKSQRLSLLM